MTPEEVSARGEGFAAAHNSHDLDRIMSWYSDDLELSEYGVGALAMDKAQARTFVAGMMEACQDLQLTTIAHYGGAEWSVWEYSLQFKHIKASPALPGTPDGRVMRMQGAALQWWNSKGQICKERAYANWTAIE